MFDLQGRWNCVKTVQPFNKRQTGREEIESERRHHFDRPKVINFSIIKLQA